MRILSLSLLPLRLYCECLMSRMLRVALGLPLSCSVLGSSVAASFFLPLISEEGSLLEEVKAEGSWDYKVVVEVGVVEAGVGEVWLTVIRPDVGKPQPRGPYVAH